MKRIIVSLAMVSLSVACNRQDIEQSSLATSANGAEPQEIVFREATTVYHNRAATVVSTDSPQIQDVPTELRHFGKTYWVEEGESLPATYGATLLDIEGIWKDPLFDHQNFIDMGIGRSPQVKTTIKEYLTDIPRERKPSVNPSANQVTLFGIKLVDNTSKGIASDRSNASGEKYKVYDIAGSASRTVCKQNIHSRFGSFEVEHIMENYLNPTFLKNLYLTTVGMVSKSYGEYVLCDYQIGGRCSLSTEYGNVYADNIGQIYDQFKSDLMRAWSSPPRPSVAPIERLFAGDNYSDHTFKISLLGGDPNTLLRSPLSPSLQMQKVSILTLG